MSVRRALAALGLALCATSPAFALGSFEVDAEGWTSEGNAATPMWNSGGFISLIDADNGWAYFRAPAAYLAPVSAGGVFSFDLKHSAPNASFPLLYGVRVALQGAGLTLIAEAAVPTTDWVRYAFSLNAAGGWRLHSGLAQEYNGSNPVPTAEQFNNVLAALTGVFIAADYTNGNLLTSPAVSDFTSIDNVALVPEPASALLLGAGLLGVLGLRRRAD